MTLRTALGRNGTAILAALLGGAWFLCCSGWDVVRPTSVDWLMSGDWAQAFIGWDFARHSPMSFPVGRLPGLLYPQGTSVAFTDSNPLLVALLRPLSPVLPQPLQYLGPWMLLCFMLQGFLGARIGAVASPHRLGQLLVGVLAALAPPLIARMNHATLCAHWLVLGWLLLYLRPSPDGRSARRTLLWAGLLVCLSASMQPYLTAMGVALTVALAARLSLSERLLGVKAALLGLGATLAGAVAVFAAFGFLDPSVPRESWGFSYYSADLLTFINPMDDSRLFPSLRHGDGQAEGMAYLGLGGILLVGTAAVSLWRRRAQWSARPLRPLVAACLLMGVFALSSKVTVAGYTFLGMRAVYATLLGPVIGAFRSPGRFTWPLFYLVLLGSGLVVLWRWRSRPRAAQAVLGVAVLLQLADLRVERFRELFQGAHGASLESPDWQLLAGRYQHLAFYPPFAVASGPGCPEGLYSMNDWIPFALLAGRSGLTFNSAYANRFSQERFLDECRALRADVEAGRLDPATVYVVRPASLSLFERPDVACGARDGVTVCVSRGRDTELVQALLDTSR